MQLVILAWNILLICWKWTQHWLNLPWTVSCDLFVVCSSVFRCVADILNDCVYCGLDNQIGDDGVIDIAEALKVNSTLVDVSWTGTNITVCFHSPLTLVSRNCKQQGCCQLHYRRIESEYSRNSRAAGKWAWWVIYKNLFLLFKIIVPRWIR